MNTLPKGASKHKKVCNTTEEDEADEEEVFRVPQAMAEEQHDALGMLTQTLVQLAEQMGALEAWEREWVEIERERLEREHERLELEWRCTMMEERQTADMDRISMAMQRQFVQGLSTGTMQKEIAAVEQEEEKGADGDNKDGMVDVEGEED